MIFKEIPKTWTKELDIPLSIKQADENTGIFEGLASTYQIDLGSDQVMPGAYQDTIKSKKTIPILWQHDTRLPIGVILEMKETEQGLYVKGKLALDVPEAKRAFSLLKLEKSVLAMSIGYQTKKDKWEGNIRKLLSLDLMEISIVTFPMNPGARFTSVKNNNLLQTAVADLWHTFEAEKKKMLTKLEELKRNNRRAKMHPVDRLEFLLNDINYEIQRKKRDEVFDRVEKNLCKIVEEINKK